MLIVKARGTMVTFTPKKVAKIAGVSTRPAHLSVVRYILENLREKGLVELWKKTFHGYRYAITSESPLWQEVKKRYGKE
ncbi:MAG: hypothetical protein DRO13_04890 [Thermoprotei archaeon]|nr:MAG: hypothetical protein DRO13_04890 [Thermoprotei archaeon]